MEFIEAITIIQESLKHTGTVIDAQAYDGIIVKKLAASNTLDNGRSTNQTHIAVTGQQLDIFPYLCADGYFYKDGKVVDNDLKKYFVISISLCLFKTNCIYLGTDTKNMIFSEGVCHTTTTVVRSKRENQADQIQVSMINMDGPEFVEFRKSIHEGDYFIMLKVRCSMQYHVFAIKGTDSAAFKSGINRLNNLFFKLSTNTVVRAESFREANKSDIKSFEVSETNSENDTSQLPNIGHRKSTRYPLNFILYGAPGTGKTYTTSNYAVSIIEDTPVDVTAREKRSDLMSRYYQYLKDGKVVFTTFHQNYGYEDFIEGIRPNTEATELSFNKVDGIFKTMSARAMNDTKNNYVIIIDEINRANISKVFGELITLIEEDKRWGEENAVSVTLPSGDLFAVPNNLYIVGTMNSADKSISLIDTALRRRFSFVEFVPELNLVKDPKLRMVLERLNTNIVQELNSTDLLIGHSYFMNKEEKDLCEIMNRSIIPLLYEYFFDNQKKVEAQVKSAVDGLDVSIKTGTMGRIKLKRKDA